MKKISAFLLTMALIVSGVSSAQAAANLGLYLGAKANLSLTSVNDVTISDTAGKESHNDTTFGGSVAVGYDFDIRFAVPIRAEVEYLVLGGISSTDNRGTNRLHMDLDSTAIMLNLYYDINTNTMITPYITAGIGMADTEMDIDGNHNNILIESDTNDDSQLAWSLGLGVGFDLTENFTIDAGYKFMSLGSSLVDRAETGIYDTHVDFRAEADSIFANVFHLGLRYTF